MILVGYIGSHAGVELMKAGRNVVTLDNLCNSDIGVLDRLATLCARRPGFIQIATGSEANWVKHMRYCLLPATTTV
jgi:UDP-glucose 4-epimerase